MSTLDLRAALQAGYVAAMAGGDPVPVEYENAEPPAVGDAPVWTSFILLPTQPNVITFGMNGEDEERSLLQIDINVPKGKGEKPLFDVLSKLQSFFTAGRVLSYNNGTATIISCGASPGRFVDNWWRRSVTVYFYARTTRPTIS